MTFPNRRGYTPGEKKRARKCAVADLKSSACSGHTTAAYGARGPTAWSPPAAVAASPPSVASRTRAGGKQRASRFAAGSDVGKRVSVESPLQAELMGQLAAFSPAYNKPQQQQHAAHASLVPLLVPTQQLKQEAEDARRSLLADELFQQQQSAHGSRLLAFENAVAASRRTSSSSSSSGGDCDNTADALRAAAQQLPAIDGSHDSDSMQSVLADLQSIGAAALHELALPLAMVDDAAVHAAYRGAIESLQELSMRQLQQALAASSTASPRVVPSSPCLALLTGDRRQQTKKRTNLSKTAKSVLKTWFDNHLHHPYPSEEEKDLLALEGGITIEQVNNWFINTRGRKWKPMLTRLMAEKEAGECKLYDQMVKRIEEPYRRAPTKR